MPSSDFVHLHVHSQYSLLDGACHLERLVAKAGEYGMGALAVTDHGNLFGAIDFYSLAKEAGIKPILGAELYVAPRSRFERSGEDGTYEGANHVTVLVKDLTGYKNLIRLVTAGYLEGFYYKPRVDKELLSRHHEGLLALSGCLNSEVARLLAAGDERKALDVASWYREVFGPENYFLEVQDHGMREQQEVSKGLLRIAKALGAPVVATNDAHYLNAQDARVHEVLLCIQTGKTMKDPDRWRFASDQFYLKSPAEMGQVFGELPEALKNTLKVAERCHLVLPLAYPAPTSPPTDGREAADSFGRLLLPKYPVPEGRTQECFLEELAYEGLKVRYPDPAPEVLDRLRYELEVIKKTGYASYFLVVWDFIRFAKERGIAVGPGRGSAAGSLVAYCLGITNIDPIGYGLLFERFLNPERISMPDMDIDFSDDRRDEVIEYVTQKYGPDKVAQIITFGTLGAKAAIRDVGRALGMPYGEVDRIAKMVPNVLNITLDEALVQSPPLAEAVKTRPEVKELWEIAKALEGLTRHASTHAAGVVISSEPLIEHVPLYKGTKGEITTQYAMGPIEKIGLLKMDFLGLRTLTVIANTVKLLASTRGIILDIDKIPLDDKKTYQLLSEAKTTGIFQLESSGMRDLLRRLRPDRFEDIIALVALYRPGPMALIDDYIARRHGKVKVTYDHPMLEPILKETYGICVYQEQVLRMAKELAGFTMSEADVLRKAMGKKDPETMAKQRKKFVEGAIARGIPQRKAEQLFDLISRFAGYAFNRCLNADAEVVDYDSGRVWTVGELFRSQRKISVVTLDENWRLMRGQVTDIVSNGVHPVFQLVTKSGRTIRATANHPFFTIHGWKLLGELEVGDRIGVARIVPTSANNKWEEYQLAVLGYFLSEGNFCHPHSFYFYSCCPEECADYIRYLEQFDNTQAHITQRRSGRGFIIYAKKRFPRRPCAAAQWLRSLGLQYHKATEKFIPDEVFTLSLEQIALLIGKMWVGDGCVDKDRQFLYYATSSPRLASQLQHLLLRFGILSTLHRKAFKYRGGIKPGYTVTINGVDNFRRFAEWIGPHLVGKRRRDLEALLHSHALLQHPAKLPRRGTKDTVPYEAFVPVLMEALSQAGCTAKQIATQAGMSGRTLHHVKKKGVCRETVALLAQVLGSLVLLRWANSDIFWDEVSSIEYVSDEEVFDLTVEGTHNFLANDFIVHNSHSAAYAFVAYQTAYLKAHYPVEFMAAILSSEIGDLDKIVKSIEECRQMEIEVLPPDVNESDIAFKVVGSKIRFGLAAVKNVGEAAIQSVLAARQREGRFHSLFDFCQRVDLRLVNKRVIESLIKCGAFDSLGAKRSQLFAIVDKAIEAGALAQRDRARGQASLLEMMGTYGTSGLYPFELPDLPEWPREQLLAAEKETLGFYITGHPLADFQEVIRRHATCTTDELLAKRDKETVKLCAIVVAVKEINTKNGDRMAFVTLEDLAGTVEAVAFPDLYRQHMLDLVKDAAVLVKGQVDHAEEAVKLLLTDVQPLPALQGEGEVVEITVVEERLNQEALRDLKALIERHSGKASILLRLVIADGREVTIATSPKLSVAPSQAFKEAVESLLGPGSLSIL